MNENLKHLRQIIAHATMHDPTRTEAMVCLDLLEADMRDAHAAIFPLEMKRYYMQAVHSVFTLPYVRSVEKADGGWVLYADATAALNAMRARLDGFKDACDKAVARRNEWAKDPTSGMCASTAEYVIEPIRAALAGEGQ
jgi:hypothetical protein